MILARAIIVSVAISFGLGRHLVDLIHEDPIAAINLLRLLVILQAIGLWTFTCPKLPIAALLVRLFGTRKVVRITLWSMAAALVVLAIFVTITTFVQCDPIDAQCEQRACRYVGGILTSQGTPLSKVFAGDGQSTSTLVISWHVRFSPYPLSLCSRLSSILRLPRLCLRALSCSARLEATDGTLSENPYCDVLESWIHVSSPWALSLTLESKD